MRSPRFRPLSRVAAALSLAALVVAGGGAPALAGTSPALPDGSKTGELVLTKLQSPPTNLPHNGTQQKVSNKPVVGATFSVQKVNNVDLTTDAGQSAAVSLSGSADLSSNDRATATVCGNSSYGCGTAQTGVTDANGVIDLANLPLGLYLVEETDSPAGTTVSVPFLVSIPLTDPTNENAWMYKVYVYPKDDVVNATKTVKDDAVAALGQAFDWTILTDIPSRASDPKPNIDAYEITDQLDSKLDYVGADVSLTDGTALTSGTDYTITPAGATTGGPLVDIVFTAAGRSKLLAHSSAQVKVVLHTSANATGDISNTANLYPDNNSKVHKHPVVTPPVDTKWGEITILKQKTGDSSTKLAGAQFQVYLSKDDAAAGTNPISIPAGSGTNTWTTDANGIASISGLRYSCYADGVALTDPATAPNPACQHYWVVETKAPPGYELQAEPIKVDVASNDPATVDVTVSDPPANNGFPLPLTGGPGVTLVYLGGLLLLAGAGAVTVSSLRRRGH